LCSSPYATCVGGTQFVDTDNPGQYWLSGNNSTNGSAISYIPETIWNESASNGGSNLWAGGGGASIAYSKPSWQTGPGVPADGRRDVPDISLSASGHDGYLIWLYGGLNATSGTSASAPAFAGLVALIDQKTNTRQGLVNTTLYPLAVSQATGGAAVFHDITTGSNAVPGVKGFAATAG
jgi:pseudomonalisin